MCAYCFRAERLLNAKGVTIHKIQVDDSPDEYRHMMRISGRLTVPQIFIDDYHVGGHDDLVVLESSGRLDELLNPA
jgi:glutaredoxin 3